jgi:hypothetical protein
MSNLAFKNYGWTNSKLLKCIWDGLLDYGKLEWDNTLKEIKTMPSNE